MPISIQEFVIQKYFPLSVKEFALTVCLKSVADAFSSNVFVGEVLERVW
jgi:hypothetical protein